MTKVNYKKVGEQIIGIVGKDNITSMTHCATRLRFVVKNKDVIDKSKFEDMEIVKGTFYNGGQFQIILGPSIVNKVYDSLMEDSTNNFEVTQTVSIPPKNKFKYAIRILAGIFIAIMPGMVATGLFLGLKGAILNDSVLGLFGTSVSEVPKALNVVISVLTDTVFAFLPALICYSAFKTFGGSPVMGFVIGLMLVNPLLPNAYSVADPNSGVEPIYIFGFIPLVGYQGSVITSIFLGFIGSKFEKVLRKKMPNALDLMFTPFLVILVTVVSGLLVFGPILHYVETGIVYVVKAIIGIPGGIGGFFIGCLYPVTVMTGMHHLFFLIESTMLGQTGYNPLITVCAMFGFSNAAVCFAISMRVKKRNEKVMGIGSGVTQLLGVSEPALFGVTLRYGVRPMSIMILCSGLGGAVLSLLGIQANSYGLAVILSPLMYLYSWYQFGMYILIGVITFALAFTLTFIFASPDKILKKEQEKKEIENKLALNKNEWTKEQRYRSVKGMKHIEKAYLKNRVKHSKWRHKFHIQPKYGLLNDPNGFSYYNDKYYLFYQWFPYGAVHGLKHWNLVTSKNLVKWSNKGPKLIPTLDHESHGIFSGSSIVKDNQLYLFYTANKRDKNWERFSSQCLAIMDEKNKITKIEKPIIKEKPVGYTNNFRDPKIFLKDNFYYMVVGAQRENETGCILTYKSSDLKKWDYVGELDTKFKNFGSMWECPDITSVDNKDVLMISALNNKKDNLKNIHNAVYNIGKFDAEKNKYTTDQDFMPIDYGFDFYAVQTTESKDKEKILVGWVGLPDTDYPTDDESWANCLSIPRKLSIVNDKLYQTPVESIFSLRKKEQKLEKELENQSLKLENLESKNYELICELDTNGNGESGVKFRVGEKEFTSIYLDSKNKKIILDRNNSGILFSEKFGEIREIPYEKNKVKFDIFVDNSTVEIFINDGEYVMTSRIFPIEDSEDIEIFANKAKAKFDITKYNLK
ncbi:hypothetical protein SHELI_v1c09310 [Spiroplasma helicoides]|uniref:Sucrose-6-phosphate hydrolase n=1 Tax=Spiroplasma helicoides TaxID=216938 RepID=A0A1B3SLV1_9MOLU|nr:sucrose-6-phosphate hydrolase [Spiroplasma helicoides]AOG60880.1 hypothetical protein SHELI_v1c09310 [Spiroplasma helicoides]